MSNVDDREMNATLKVDEFELAGVSDGFQRLWTPHRLAYVAQAGINAKMDDPCPFCEVPKLDDEQALIVHRGEHAFVVLNLYPYNAGHMLICPYRHVSDYPLLEETELNEISKLTQQTMLVLRKILQPAGFNLGMNQGIAGGAGIADHLHQHIVPRWVGDSNFMPIVAQTKTITQIHAQMREKIANLWEKILNNEDDS